MTDKEIDRLIARRNKLTNRRDGLYDHKRVNRIDAKLVAVPPGTRNDVDLLLGRPDAVLPKRCTCGAGYLTIPREHEPGCGLRSPRVVMVQHVDGTQQVETAWADQTADFDAHMAQYGAEIEDSPRDWQDMRGNLAL